MLATQLDGRVGHGQNRGSPSRPGASVTMVRIPLNGAGQMAVDEADRQAAELLLGQRWAALATLLAGAPSASMVAYAVTSARCGLLLHLSRLARHTRSLLETGRAGVVVSEGDDGRADPQELARLSLACSVSPILAEQPGYASARACYLARFPAAELRFGFADIVLIRLDPQEVRFVGGFARAFKLSPQRLDAAVRARSLPG
jgi:putative heme iron utilization protein